MSSDLYAKLLNKKFNTEIILPFFFTLVKKRDR